MPKGTLKGRRASTSATSNGSNGIARNWDYGAVLSPEVSSSLKNMIMTKECRSLPKEAEVAETTAVTSNATTTTKKKKTGAAVCSPNSFPCSADCHRHFSVTFASFRSRNAFSYRRDCHPRHDRHRRHFLSFVHHLPLLHCCYMCRR